jgi:hypothetical protein
VVRHLPKDPGSWYRLQAGGLERAARKQALAAVRALRSPRPVAWLALALYQVRREHGAAMARADVRRIVGHLLTSLAVTSDYRSGRRSRPGRQVSAAIAECAERTVERWWPKFGELGLLQRTKAGKLLPAGERQTSFEDPYPDPDATDVRWRDRAEFTLLLSREVQEGLSVEDLWPYLVDATQMLAELASRIGPLPARAAARVLPVDSSPSSVALSLVLDFLSCLTVTNSLSVERPRTIKAKRATSRRVRRPDGREVHKGGASRLSPTEEGAPDRPEVTPEALATASQVVSRGFFPGLGPWATRKVAERLLELPTWTPEDIELEAQRRLDACHKHLVSSPDSPFGYFRWLLAYADPDRPPFQARQAIAGHLTVMRTAREQARHAMWDARDAAAAALDSPARAAARAAAARAAERGRTTGQAGLVPATTSVAGPRRPLSLAERRAAARPGREVEERRRRERDQRLAAAFGASALPGHVSDSGDAWPPVAQPGSGLGR